MASPESKGSRSAAGLAFYERIILVCVLIVGIPLVAYAMGLPDKYIEGLFLLMLLVYLVPQAFNKTDSKRDLQDREE